MRLFTAFDIPSSTGTSAAKICSLLKAAQPRGFKPVDPANMHITLEFIGEYPEENIPALISGLSDISADTCSIECRGTGFFPLETLPPKVIWIGAKLNGNMKLLYSAISRTLRNLKINTDEKPFYPHLTIGRLKNTPTPEFMNIINEYRDVSFGTFTAEAFHLYRSDPGDNGPVYTVIKTYKLGG